MVINCELVFFSFFSLINKRLWIFQETKVVHDLLRTLVMAPDTLANSASRQLALRVQSKVKNKPTQFIRTPQLLFGVLSVNNEELGDTKKTFVI